MRVPRATYRFQFNESFRLVDALALVPYLHDLGISHIYASPLFQASAHSVHGYDVCDFDCLNSEVGTEADLEALVTALKKNGMGLVLDIVPNHMGIGTAENKWWWDVLKNGRQSKFASHFDVNWETSDPQLHGKILLPVLGDAYEQVLDKGELKVERQDMEKVLCYFKFAFPLAPGSWSENFSIETINSDHAALDALIKKQNYRLAEWREANECLNYRRFFAVNTLAALRIEDEKVFSDVHAGLKKWIDRGWLDGLRVDHPDGLRDPEEYLRRLRGLAPDLWIVVEKILQPKEPLPATWPVQGTVGYDFLNQLNGLFIDSVNETVLTDCYADFTGETVDPAFIVRAKKRLVIQSLFITEVNRLAEMLVRINRSSSDAQWRDALIEIVADLPVYRTYIRNAKNDISENDRHFIRQTIGRAREGRPDLPGELFNFLGDLFLSNSSGPREIEFIARFQQLTGPAMAKGVEDTAFFSLNRFASLNEVGGDPGKFGVSIEEFHEFCGQQHAQWPDSMLSSSTHDTKRSEDVRARLNVLSEIPHEWRATVSRWSKVNEAHRRDDFPDRNMECLLYQTLAGAWPITLERLQAYMEKASCEAKQHTDWDNRNTKYDEALRQFVTAVFADRGFLQDLEKFIGSIQEAAQTNSLAQTLVKLTAPGVPDIYQGNELWDFSLVDPDNRRPVDFAVREKLLAEGKKLSAGGAWKRREEGLPKLWLIQKVLRFRKTHEDVFRSSYTPLLARGEGANRILAFMRDENTITVVPRFQIQSKRQSADTRLTLPPGEWRSEFTGEQFRKEIAVGSLFKQFPVAFLTKGR